MKWLKNDRGLTLVELLAAIIIFSIILLVLWRFLFQVVTANEVAVSQKQLQQEANLILNTVQQMHTKYTITKIERKTSGDNSFIVINAFEQPEMKLITETFNNNNIKYDLFINIKKPINGSFSEAMTNPVTDFEFNLTLTSVANKKISHQSSTIFSKLAGKK